MGVQDLFNSKKKKKPNQCQCDLLYQQSKENYTIPWIDATEAFDNIQQKFCLWLETLRSKNSRELTLTNKGEPLKHIANIILNDEKMNVFLLTLGTRQECLP